MRPCFFGLVLFYLSACGHAPPPEASAAGAPAAQPPSVEKRTTCKQNEDTRVLQIRSKGDGACDVVYTKFGSEKSVASGGMAYCEKVSEQIKMNLARSGFTCE
jgi:hypothetical protein